jgi:hypothetical protein
VNGGPVSFLTYDLCHFLQHFSRKSDILTVEERG